MYVVALLAWALAAVLVPETVLTAHQPHRAAQLAIIWFGVGSTNLLLLTPFERVVRSDRWREPFFVLYSVVCVFVLAAFVLLDGGSRSPAIVALALPTLFAALSYPVPLTVAVGAIDLAAYVVICVGTDGGSTANALVIGGVLTIVAILCGWQSRIHERQRLELRRLARTDPLTGCLNRRGFEERLDAEVRQAVRDGRRVGVLLLDLDGFKAVNDEHGHATGDELLCWTATTTAAVLRPRDAVGRVGGDEFAVVLPGADPGTAAAVAARLSAVLAARAPATLGVATFPADAMSLDELLRCADRRLYREKRAAARVAGVAASRLAERTLPPS